MKIRQTLLASLLMLFISCTPTKQSHFQADTSALQGQISEDRFYDSTNTFSVPVMKNAIPQLIVSEEINSELTAVLFSSDFGQLERIEVVKGAKPQYDALAPGLDHPSIQFEFIYDTILQALPGTKVLEKKSVRIEGVGTCCAGVLYIPRGSTLIELSTRQRQDSTRSYVISYADDNLVTISVQELPHYRLITGISDDEANDRLINQAIEIRKNYRNL